MSITSVSSYMSVWQRPGLQNRGTSGSGTAAVSGDTTTNAGTVPTNGNAVAYMQAFSADLQSMLTQMGTDASTSANSNNTAGTTNTTTANATSSADPSQYPNALHRLHHHNGRGEGDDGTMDDGAHQLVGGIDQISKSASPFATDVRHALATYGSMATNDWISPGRSTVA
jgi:hypothetical protein